MITTLVKLLMGHALADFSLQTEWMAKHKNRHVAPSFIPPGQKQNTTWPYVLTAHALIHGMVVWLVTQNIYLGMVETATHWTIDFMKCENLLNIHEDQGLHILCKALYLLWV